MTLHLPRSASQITHGLADQWVQTACLGLGLGFMHVRDSRKQPDARGWPDYVITGSRVIFREYKSPGDTLRPDQRYWRGQLQRAGADWAIWTAADLIDGTIMRELTALAVG